MLFGALWCDRGCDVMTNDFLHTRVVAIPHTDDFIRSRTDEVPDFVPRPNAASYQHGVHGGRIGAQANRLLAGGYSSPSILLALFSTGKTQGRYGIR